MMKKADRISRFQIWERRNCALGKRTVRNPRIANPRILIILCEIYRYLRKNWLRRLLEKRKKEKRTRKPAVLRPKREKDCRFCRENQGKRAAGKREIPESWQSRKGRGGPKKKIQTEGFFCPNKSCEYDGIREQAIHALVGYGQHGKCEAIQDFLCQACGKKFTARRNTILYRLKSPSDLIEKILWLSAIGVDASALEEVFGVREMTFRTWLCRSGMLQLLCNCGRSSMNDS